MPRDTRAGVLVHWKAYGATPDTLLIHCSLAHQGAWIPLIKAMDLSAIAFDKPGHGQSGGWDSVTDYQTQTAEIAATFCAPAQHVIGHSFGATVALRLALEHPDLVRSLVLIEPVFFAAARGTPAFEAHERAFGPFIAALEEGDKPLAAKRFTDIWGSGQPWETLPEAQRADITRRIHIIPAGAPAIHEDNAGQLAPGRLESLETPTLLIHADQSDPVTGAINAELAKRLPNASSIKVNGAGHMGPITHPQLYAKPINAFRASLAASSL